MKKSLITVFLFYLVLGITGAQSSADGDWFSTDTLASVVKLSSFLGEYIVDGLPDDYTYRTKGGNPDFGSAKIVSEDYGLVSVGTGVIVSDNGVILSNAHVTRAYIEPSIDIVYGAGKQQRIGESGKPLKRVLVNIFPDYMFVGVTTKEELDKGNDAQKPSYAAFIIDDDKDYGRNNRDRALLKIQRPMTLSQHGVPIVGDPLGADFKITYAKLENPFKTSFVDKKVRAIGFPGSGDPNRSSRTTGELLGYESSNSSVLLHTSWISNGNSGGGLFYKDALIGINTWDNRSTASRPVAMAQPVTYWSDMIAKFNYIYPRYAFSGLNYAWVDDDPSTDAYKDTAYIRLRVVKDSNRDVPVTTGRVYAYRNDVSIRDAVMYESVCRELDEGLNLMRLLWNFSVDEIVAAGYDRQLVEAFSKLNRKEEIVNLLTDAAKPYFDAWCNGEFYSVSSDLDEDVGKLVLSLPKNSKVIISYVTDEGTLGDSWNLTVDSNYVQGAYTVTVK